MDWNFIEYMNPHWEKNYFYNYEIEREVLKRVENKNKLIKLIIGPRRVGKTVMMKQVIDKLIKKGVNRRNILYVLLEQQSSKILDIIKEWEKLYGINIRGNIFLFLDEIQFLEKWENEVKLLYDTFPNMRIYLSGSAGSVIREKTGILAGRIEEIFVNPLSFNDYFNFKGKNKPIGEKLLWEEYNEYMFKELPEIVALRVDSKDYITSLIEKVIKDDMKKIFSAVDEELIRSLIRIIFKSPGQMIEYSELGNELGVNRETISKYLKGLEDSFVIRRVFSYSRNIRKTERKKKKFYPFYTTLLHYISPNYPDFSYILETDVAEKINASFYFYDRGKEIDFIIPECSLAIEVKSGKKVSKTSIKTLINSKFKNKVVVAPPYTEVEAAKKVVPYKIDNLCK